MNIFTQKRLTVVYYSFFLPNSSSLWLGCRSSCSDSDLRRVCLTQRCRQIYAWCKLWEVLIFWSLLSRLSATVFFPLTWPENKVEVDQFSSTMKLYCHPVLNWVYCYSLNINWVSNPNYTPILNRFREENYAPTMHCTEEIRSCSHLQKLKLIIDDGETAPESDAKK